MSIREQLVTATETYLGVDGNMLEPLPENCRRLKLPHPILTNRELAKIKHISAEGFKSYELNIVYDPNKGEKALEKALEYLGKSADAAIKAGATLIVLTDRMLGSKQAPIPALLATSALHHHLIKNGNRVKVSLVVESAEPREVHHFACLLGYGAEAINPYLAFESIDDLLQKQLVTGVSSAEAEQKYVKGLVKGIVKVCSKMGISTIQSYGAAQIFEALGLNSELVDRYFTGTPSRIQGSDLAVVAKEILARHKLAFPDRVSTDHALPTGGKYQVRDEGEDHVYDPATVHALQNAVRMGRYKAFKRYSAGVNSAERRRHTLRGLLDFKKGIRSAVALSEVESVDEILSASKRAP